LTTEGKSMQDGSDGNAEGISPRKDSPTGSSPTQNPSIGLENALQWADPETLTISDHNVRKTEVKGPRSTWEELVQSVKDHGVIVPPIVTPSGKVIVGQRRVLAAREAKVKSIQAKILSQEPPEDKAIALCMIENEHRDAIDPNDRLDALLRLQKIYKDNDKVAKAIGRSRYTLTAWLSVSSTREEVPNLLDVGIEKARTLKGMLSSPQYNSASVEEKKLLVEQAKKTDQATLRAMRREAGRGKIIPRTPIHLDLLLPQDLYHKAMIKAMSQKKNIYDWIEELITLAVAPST